MALSIRKPSYSSTLIRNLFLLFSLLFSATAVSGSDEIRRSLADDDRKFTTIGSIGLTISNFGTIGHGFNYWPTQPSCEYPKGSGIEHLFVGGIWVGGIRRGQLAVTTGAVDISRVFDVAAGFEYTNQPEATVGRRSSLLDNPYFSLEGISHQDFVAEYVDTNLFIPGTTTPIPDHVYPLKIAIHQESYAWNFPFAENFVLLSYTIRNIGHAILDTLDSVYVALWTDTVIRNTRLTGRPSGTAFYSAAGNGWVDSLRMQYTFDFGDLSYPPSDSYIGIKLLGVTPLQRLRDGSGISDSLGANAMFNAWFFRNTTDPVYFSPTTDDARFVKMAQPLRSDQIVPLRLTPGNRMTLIATGPFSRLAPGDSINVALAVITARKGDDGFPAGSDSISSRVALYGSARLAQQAYNGEDRNGNGIQDQGEIWTGPNGRPRRYFLPEPPSVPKLRVVPGDRTVTVYWDHSAEASIDPISNERDFEGYRVYRTNAGEDLKPEFDPHSSLILIGEFDLPGNSIGYNTGFQRIRLSAPIQFPGDPVQYSYSMTIPHQLNGWQYVYAVTAFDRGDPRPEFNLGILESSRLANAVRAVPGIPARSGMQAPVSVYPNPYYARASWDGTTERERKIYFTNLPARCQIRIYTLTGDIVDEVEHVAATYSGEDIQWFTTVGGSSGKRVFAGGEHAWDLISKFDQAIATGMYLFTVQDHETGEIQRGRFLVVK